MSDLLVNVDGASETEMFQRLFSDYAKCKHGKCASEADYLAVCYKCHTSNPMCGECADALPTGSAAVTILGTCGDIVLTSSLTIVSRQ